MNGKFKEVIRISSTIPSIYVHNTSFALFEKRNKGIGMKCISKMGCEGGGININFQGIINPIMVEERLEYMGLGYGRKEFGECSKHIEAHQESEEEISPPCYNFHSSTK